MSILTDRRSLREIGGIRAYMVQVGWSLWWRTQGPSAPWGDFEIPDRPFGIPEAEAIPSGSDRSEAAPRPSA